MNYYAVVNTIVIVLYLLMALLTVHFAFFAIVGFFKKKTFLQTDKRLKYGIIIPARNEETVVGALIESIKKNDYPQDKLHIFVIAHNCDDKTADIARAAGATVYEYNNPEECTMGYAFKYLFARIKEDYGTENYDGFFLFNADNILDRNYFKKMNDAFVYYDKQSVITSFRNSKNFGSNPISAMYGLYFASGCRFESRGRSVMGCSTRVQGTGYVINSDIVKDEWPYVTLTEDWEFTADRVINDTPIVFCDEAVFYDEQPVSLGIMWRQRLRWSKGHLLVCVTRLKDIVKALFKPVKRGGAKRKFSVYDIGVNILPVCVITVAITVLKHVFFLLSPLFGLSLKEVYTEYLGSFWFMYAIGYVSTVLSAVILYILERKRIPKMSLGLKIVSIVLWPVFLLVSFPAEVVAVLKKDIGWKPIPHADTTTFDHLNESVDEDSAESDAVTDKKVN